MVESVDTWPIPELLKKAIEGELEPRHIRCLVRDITNGHMEETQLGALLMAVYFKGLSPEATNELTYCMMKSGTILKDLWNPQWKVVDKHSTGGVGDKVSLPLAPALASLGLKVPMISGRGLEHTGGTLDKLESIPGLGTSLEEESILRAMEQVGCCIVGQTSTLVPADKKMYAARNVTSTVASTPLIVGSIVSKKAAEGLSDLVLDVKFGNGSFMKTLDQATLLAEKMILASESAGIRTTAVLSHMNAPIGRKIGNSLEVQEALDCLRGRGPEDLRELVVVLGGEVVVTAGMAKDSNEGAALVAATLDDGRAMKKFSEMIQFQGVSKEVAERLCCGDTPDFSDLPKSAHTFALKSPASGYVEAIHALTLGMVSYKLGGGRKKASDPISYGVGIELLKEVGDPVVEGEEWARVHYDNHLQEELVAEAQSAFAVVQEPSRKQPRISRIIRLQDCSEEGLENHC